MPSPETPSRQMNLTHSGHVSTSAEAPQIAKHKQNSGPGEGLIYNIPEHYFQMTWRILMFAARTPGKTHGHWGANLW
jgi:hypothetical protein